MDDLDRMFRRLVQNIRTGYPDLLSRPFEVAELYQNIIPYRHNRSELGLEQNQDYEFALMRLLSGERGYLVVDDGLRDGMQRELASPSPDTGAFRAFSTSAVSLSSEAVRRLDQYLAGGARPDDARLGRTASRAAGDTAPRIAPPPPPLAPPPVAPPAPSASFLSPPPPPPPVMPPPPPRSLEADAAAATMAMPGHRHAPPIDPRPQPRPPQPRAEPHADPRGAAAGERREAAPLDASSRQAPGGGSAGAGAGAGAPGNPGPRAGAGAGGTVGQDERCHYCDGLLPAGRKVNFCPHCGQNLTVRHCPACSTELEVGWKFCIACGRSVEA